MQHPPLKRHPALQPLSRDHYTGLVQAQHLIKAADQSQVERRATLGAFCDAWRSEIEPHFLDEERLLTDLMNDTQRARFEQEHAALRDLATEAHEKRRDIDPDADWMRQLGQSLNDHIRWEERELFPALEKVASSTTLQELQRQTQPIEAARHRRG